MDIQKYFNKGPITWYAVFNENILERISHENINGSIPFQTQTYEMAEDTPNAVAEIKELFRLSMFNNSSGKQGFIELVFLKIMLSPRVLRFERFHNAFKDKIEEALNTLEHSKIIKDAPKVLKMNEPVIQGNLKPI